MAHKISIFTLIGVILFSVLSHALVVDINKSASSVEFLAVGRPSMLKIRGKGASVEGKLSLIGEKSLGDLKVDLESFDTGMALRNKHMKEKYLETKDEAKRYAILKISKLKIADGDFAKNQTVDVPFSGYLSLHGVTKDISSTAHLKIKDKNFDGTTQLKIKLSDYNINIPSFAGVTVAEDVSVDIQLKGQIKDAVK